jgi:hypothetical protein
VRYRGALLEVRADHGKVAVRALEGGPVTVAVYGIERLVDAEGVVVPREQPSELPGSTIEHGSLEGSGLHR